MTSKLVKAIVVAPVVSLSLLLGATVSSAYTVKKGDTLGEIATDNNLTLSEIVNLNPNISNINLIYIGDNINTDTGVSTNTNTKTNTNTVHNSERYLLARLVEAEARGESFEGKVAVASVVLNRKNDKAFPDNISGVIYERGQFSPVSNGSISNEPSADSLKAVDHALSGYDNTMGSLYFYNPSIATSTWLASLETVVTIGSHVFKK